MNNSILTPLLMTVLLLITAPLSASEIEIDSNQKPTHEENTIIEYSHLAWQSSSLQAINIQVLPIKNLSGIPIERREETADYFSHGKIPQQILTIFSDLVSASRYLQVPYQYANQKPSPSAVPDYYFQLTIDNYQLPFEYAADDSWWKKMHDDVDRWLIKPESSIIKLSLTISSGKKWISPWHQSIETRVSDCDLNLQIQPLTSNINQDKTVREYLKTTSGQSFVAASNYLILQAIQKINQRQAMAKVISKFENEIFIVAEKGQFTLGEKLDIYYQPTIKHQSLLPAGKIEIIKTYKNQAVAYPVNMRSDQIKVGDWIELNEKRIYSKPKSVFKAKNNCGGERIVQLL